MTFSSCLTNKDNELVLDSSVLINLLATGHSTSILKALGALAIVTDNVVQEIESGSTNGRPELDLLKQMVGDQVLRVRKLEGQSLDMFFELVSGSASHSLGDGEAATLAFAHETGCSAAIDEKKATRLAGSRFKSMKLVTTVDILAHDAVRMSLGCELLADATFRALRLARMQVREQQFEWVAQLIGPEQVEACSSLRRLAKRRSAVFQL
jgi:predicted nucleic acid-binding protein